MDLPSSRAVLLFVVRKGKPVLRQFGGVVAAFLRTLCAAILRIIITGVVFSACTMLMLHYLGVPVPGPSDLLDKFAAVGRLTRILS